MVAVSPVVAEDANVFEVVQSVDDKAEHRINFSDMVRMLLQSTPSAVCHMTQGIYADGASMLLVVAPAEFRKTLSALEFDDNDLNILRPEYRRMTIHTIHALREKWEPMKAFLSKLGNGTASDGNLINILAHNMTVLGAAQSLVSELVQPFSNLNAVPFADLLLVDISSRQRI